MLLLEEVENGRILGEGVNAFPNVVSKRLVDENNAREGLRGRKISRNIVVAESVALKRLLDAGVLEK